MLVIRLTCFSAAVLDLHSLLMLLEASGGRTFLKSPLPQRSRLKAMYGVSDFGGFLESLSRTVAWDTSLVLAP